MDRDAAIQEVKTHLTDYLQEKGLPLNKPFNCLNPDHDDVHPSMSYDRQHNLVHCFSCGKSYDLLDLIQQDNKCGFSEALEIACKKYGIKLDGNQGKQYQKPEKQLPKQETEKDYTELFQKAEKDLQFAKSYLQERGISETTARRFHLGVDRMNEHATEPNGQEYLTEWTCLVIPTSRNSYVIRNMDRAADHRNRYRKEGKTHLFNLEDAEREEKRPVLIVEGEIDAMSIIEAGGQAIGLGSTSNINLLLEKLEKWKPKTPLVIALDNDKEGKTKAKELKEKLDEKHIRNFIYKDLYGMCKDANETLTTNRQYLENAIKEINEHEKKEYLQTSAAAHLDDFLTGISERANTPPISTGFKNMDTILDGGLYEGLYFIGAVSSLGKTTMCLQIADQIAQAGQDVLIFSLEMARSELMAKSISRLTYLETLRQKTDSRYAKTTRGILDGSRYKNYGPVEKQIYFTALDNYKKYADHIFISEGIGNIGVAEIRDTVQKHIALTGNKPVVIIDYVQILAPADVRATDKQNTDKAVLELKRLSRDEKIPVIGISSFNRESYKAGSNNNGRVSMADFKESGAIEYSADVLMGLEFQAAGKGFTAEREKEEKKKEPREIRLVVLKNRNGKAWQSCTFNYFPMFNYYEETKETGETDSTKEF